jgi:hypothetical protein
MYARCLVHTLPTQNLSVLNGAHKSYIEEIQWLQIFLKRLVSWVGFGLIGYVQSTAHQTIHFGLCTALISSALALKSHCKCIA